MNKKAYSAHMTCESFYVGDPCFVLNRDIYDKVGCACDDLSGTGDTDGGVGSIDGKAVIVVHLTAFGDGFFDGYDVESGQLAVVNGDFCKKDRIGNTFFSTESGEIDVELEYDDGIFYVSVTDSGTGKELFYDEIDTSLEDDDDDEWDEDGDEWDD